MDISELKKIYEFAKEGDDLSGEKIKRSFAFLKLLLSNNSPEFIRFHYDLLKKRECKELYYDIRAAFKKRPEAEEFLVEQILTETDPITLGDILHILGGVRSSHAAPLARQFVNSDNEYQREVALYVLGWVGNEMDLDLIKSHLLEERSSRLRRTSASAHRQVYWRLPELKDKLLASLKQGFEQEKDDEVMARIIIMIESIAVKKLGLREDKQDPYIIHGDVQKAKLKTAKFLSELKL
ncbi:HEAT repeat domain-containing protein [Anaerosinus massiliensis]|uniref:HEAT repeat domain-containing protein n=1 Tax=Massilibacillus massiliensis TaxID=1806837 RepID=UPI0018FF1125|nr:HEAT repeat domain-containing protein [Massilibacillus massiliensis]